MPRADRSLFAGRNVRNKSVFAEFILMTQASHISLPEIFCVAPTGVFRWADGNGSARSGMCFYLMGDSDAAFAFVRRLADDAFIVRPRICATYQRGVQTGQRADRRCWLLDHSEPA